MNDMDYLKLLESTLSNSALGTSDNMGALANDIESIRSSLEVVSEDFSDSFARLWAALEVVAVQHQEQGTFPTKKEINDLEEMKNDLLECTVREISARRS